MKIAIDISPIIDSSLSDHKVRGVGKYINLLKENLERYDSKNTYFFTSTPFDLNTEIDLIHYPYFDPFFITLPYRSKIPFIVTVHDIIPIAHKNYFPGGVKGNIRWVVNKLLLKRSKAIIADSEASKTEIVKLTGYNKNKVYPVFLSVDEEFKIIKSGEWEKEFRSKYKLPDKFLLYVGDITWNKNLPRLVKVVKELGYPLVMVGKAIAESNYDRRNTWNKDRIIVEQLTKDNPNFIKLGFVPTDDLVKLYNLAHFLCMPSLDEGFGLPVLEAFKCGCPALISYEGSLPEVGGDAAIYVDGYKKESISEKIQFLMKDENLREKLKDKIQIQAAKFTLEKFIKDTVKVYETIKL